MRINHFSAGLVSFVILVSITLTPLTASANKVPNIQTLRGINDIAVEAFVTRFYQMCLGRNPEPTGLEGWTNALLNGVLTGSDVAYGFILSDEFIAKNTSNEDYLLILYRAFFDREPDTDGWNGWLGLLYAAQTAADEDENRIIVLDGFIASQEFYELCYSFGISTGESCLNNLECGPNEYCSKEVGDCEGIGKCELRWDPFACLDVFDPVCGCDGNTYNNSCYAALADVNIFLSGVCSAESL